MFFVKTRLIVFTFIIFSMSRNNGIMKLPPEEYSASNIKTMKGLAAIINRPTLYVDDLEIDGQLRLAIEVIDNAIDEVVNKVGGLVRIFFFRDLKKRKYQIVVTDNGRGIPIGNKKGDSSTFLRIVTEPHTSGKYDTSSYIFSAGIYGIGFKVTVALSTACRVITTRPEARASISVKNGEHKPVVLEPFSKVNSDTSTTVLYTPNTSIMVDTELFSEIGPERLINRLCKQTFFSQYKVNFIVVDQLLPNNYFEELSSSDVLSNLDKIEQENEVTWCSQTYDRTKWIRDYWNVRKEFDWERTISINPQNAAPFHQCQLHLYYNQGARQGNRFGIVNGIPIDNYESDNIKMPIQCLKTELAKLIEDAAIKKFFILQYKFPIFLASQINYGGAEFSSAIKNIIKSPPFRERISKEITNYLTNTDMGKEIVSSLYTLIEEDIESAYLESIGDKVIHTSRGRIFEKLKRKRFFSDGINPTELFLTEGASASGTKTIKEPYQAIYALSGVTKNVVHKIGQSKGETFKELLSNDIYADILTLLNYDPRSSKPQTLNFKKIFIMVDGDAHGKHIASIILGAFQLIAPDLIEKGLFSVVAPPYYRLSIGTSKKDNKFVYVRDHEHLLEWYTRFVYFKNLKIKIYPYDSTHKVKTLSIDEMIPLVHHVYDIGLELDNVANALQIDPYILESLCYCVNELSKGVHMNTDKIKKACSAERVIYNEQNNSIMITMIKEDHIIPLQGVVEKMFELLISKFNRIRWKLWYPTITTLTTKTYTDFPLTIYQLYKILVDMVKNIDDRVLKGIGSMGNNEAYITCLNPVSRRVFNITSIGDVHQIFNLLGDDSTSRKKLVEPPKDDFNI